MKEEKENKKIKKVKVGPGNIVSQLFFFWVFPFILVVRKARDLKDILFVLRKKETCKYNDEVLEKAWSKEKEKAAKKNRPPKIRSAIFRTYGAFFVLNGIWKIVWGISLWFGAYWLLKQTISYVRAKSTDQLTGHMYALGFFLSSAVSTIAINQLVYTSGRLGLRAKSALMTQIFKKSLVLTKVEDGNIVNLASNDCQKIADSFTNLQYLWSAVLEVIGKHLNFKIIEIKLN